MDQNKGVTMASNLKELIEEWEFREGSLEAWEHHTRDAIEECIEDLKSTMLVMEADAVVATLCVSAPPREDKK